MAFVDSYFKAFQSLIEESKKLPPLDNYDRTNAASAYGEDYKAIIAAIQINDVGKIEKFFQDCLPGGELSRYGYQLKNHLILEGLYEAVGHGQTKMVELFLQAAKDDDLCITGQKKWHGTMACRPRNMFECALEGNNPDIVKLLAPHFKRQINNPANHAALLRYASQENQKLLITEYGANPGDSYDPKLNKLFTSIVQDYILSGDMDKLKKYTLTANQLYALEPLYSPTEIVNIPDEILTYLTPLLPMDRVFLILLEQKDEVIVEKLLSLVTVTIMSRQKFIDKLSDLEYLLKNNPATNPKILQLLGRVKNEQCIERAAEKKFEDMGSAAVLIATTGYIGNLFYASMRPKNPPPHASGFTYSPPKPPKQASSCSLPKKPYCTTTMRTTTPMREMHRMQQQPFVTSVTTAPLTRLLRQVGRLAK